MCEEKIVSNKKEHIQQAESFARELISTYPPQIILEQLKVINEIIKSELSHMASKVQEELSILNTVLSELK